MLQGKIVSAWSTRKAACVKRRVGKGKTTEEATGRNKRREKNTQYKKESTLQKNGYGVLRSTSTHHPVPVRSLLNDRLDPDDNVSRQNRRGSEMLLGSRFQAEVVAREVAEGALSCETRLVRGPDLGYQEGGETNPVLLHVK